MGGNLLDKTDFNRIRKKLESYDAQREILIKKRRDVLKTSKQLIYSLHRDELKSAEKLLAIVKSEKKRLDDIAKKHKNLFNEGSYSEANQEYVEAIAYYQFIKNNKIPRQSSLSVSYEDYLLGICDLTGELTRRAVTLASKRKIDEFEKTKILVEEIYGEFLKFNLRNGLLRKKSDSIKWNLKKLEEISYDIRKNAIS